jgi:hypothetical protein
MPIFIGMKVGMTAGAAWGTHSRVIVYRAWY